MLVLSRRKKEKIELPDCGITITVLDTRSNRVRIGIDAPPHIAIRRAELTDDFEESQPAFAATCETEPAVP